MKYLKITLVMLIISFPAKEIAAQQYIAPEVTISQELISINGVVFYMHIVKKRETLFSIAKAYSVTIEDIEKVNPKLSQGLKEGDYIYIRKGDQSKTEIANQTVNEAAKINEAELSRADQRRVRQAERTETTAKTERTETNNKIELNPQDIQTIHTVRWYETLSSIARRYNVSEEEISLANSLANNTISTRQQLRIPRAGAISRIVANSSEVHYTPDDEDENEDKDEDLLNIFGKPYYDQLTISLQLPLGSNIDTTMLNSNSDYIEFYQGFLLAINDLRKEYSNMDINLKTHDMMRYVRESEIISSNSLNGSDLIIGPLYSEQQRPFIDFAYNNNAIFVSPIDSQSEIYTATYPNFFQITTPAYFQQESLLSTLSDATNVIMFHEEGSYDTSVLDMTKKILEKNGIQYHSFSYHLQREGRLVASRIDPMLSRTEKNYIVIASDSEAFVFDLLGKLNTLKSQHKLDIAVYGTSKWRAMDIIDISYFHNLNLHIPVQYHVDYSNGKVKEFVYKFREIYAAEPTPYAFLAYDIACYFIEGMYTRLRDSGIGTTRRLLQSDYNFIIKPDEKGFSNIGVRLLIYNPDFSTELRTLIR